MAFLSPGAGRWTEQVQSPTVLEVSDKLGFISIQSVTKTVHSNNLSLLACEYDYSLYGLHLKLHQTALLTLAWYTKY